MQKNVNSRITHKNDIEENWSKAVNFIPLDGELIIYNPDSEHEAARIKIGDGVTNVNDLPFIADNDASDMLSGVGIELSSDGGIILTSPETNQSLSQFTTTSGVDNISGSKAFRITNIDVPNKAYTLDSTEGLEVGDTYSINLRYHVYNMFMEPDEGTNPVYDKTDKLYYVSGTPNCTYYGTPCYAMKPRFSKEEDYDTAYRYMVVSYSCDITTTGVTFDIINGSKNDHVVLATIDQSGDYWTDVIELNESGNPHNNIVDRFALPGSSVFFRFLTSESGQHFAISGVYFFKSAEDASAFLQDSTSITDYKTLFSNEFLYSSAPNYNVGKITSIDDNSITVDVIMYLAYSEWEPSDSYVDEYGIETGDDTICIVSKPEVGTISIGAGAFSAGLHNQALAYGAFVAGNNNVGWYGTSVLGDNNNIYHYNSIGIGSNLASYKKEQVLLGKYNSESDADIIIGNGASNARRKNALEIFGDGQILAGADTIKDNDRSLTTKKYVDQAVGGAVVVETAYSESISIEPSLIYEIDTVYTTPDYDKKLIMFDVNATVFSDDGESDFGTDSVVENNIVNVRYSTKPRMAECHYYKLFGSRYACRLQPTSKFEYSSDYKYMVVEYMADVPNNATIPLVVSHPATGGKQYITIADNIKTTNGKYIKTEPIDISQSLGDYVTISERLIDNYNIDFSFCTTEEECTFKIKCVHFYKTIEDANNDASELAMHVDIVINSQAVSSDRNNKWTIRLITGIFPVNINFSQDIKWKNGIKFTSKENIIGEIQISKINNLYMGEFTCYGDNAPSNSAMLTIVELSSNDWVDNKQVVEIQGVTDSNAIIVNCSSGTKDAYNASGVYCSAQAINSLTFTCSSVPSVDVKAEVLILATA